MKKLFLNDAFILSLILINAVVIFFVGYVEDDKVILALNYIDHGITSLFIIEILVKLRVFGRKTFFESSNLVPVI